jgi:uncharacterized protein YecT (DUF1311 family)
MKMIFINFAISLAIFSMPCISKSSGLNTYDFRDECGFHFLSPYEFTGSSEKCWKVKMTDDDFIIGDHIYSTKELFPNLQGKADSEFFGGKNKNLGAGYFARDAKGKIYTLRESYTQDFYGGISFAILKKKEVISLKKRSDDKIISFLVRIGREDPICIDHDDEECWEKAEKSKWIEKNYECWDGLFFGKDGISGVVVIGLCSPSKSAITFASLDSWQAKLIKSLVVTIGEETSCSSPDFDCNQSNTEIEKIIRADKNLSLLDATLDRNYQQLKVSMNNKGKPLPEDQREWLKERDACKTSECLTETYTRRIDELCTKYSAALDGAFACTLSKDIEFPEQAPE